MKAGLKNITAGHSNIALAGIDEVTEYEEMQNDLFFGGEIVPYQFPALKMGLFVLVLFGMELFFLCGQATDKKAISD